MADAELKPCPFCNNVPTIRIFVGKDGWRDRYAVLCRYDEGGCGAESGLYHYKEEAVEAWNRRAVKRGHWIEKSEEYYKLWRESGRNYNDMPYFITGLHFACGVCFDKYEVNAEGVEFWDFCPHCGAEMRGKNDE